MNRCQPKDSHRTMQCSKCFFFFYVKVCGWQRQFILIRCSCSAYKLSVFVCKTLQRCTSRHLWMCRFQKDLFINIYALAIFINAAVNCCMRFRGLWPSVSMSWYMHSTWQKKPNAYLVGSHHIKLESRKDPAYTEVVLAAYECSRLTPSLWYIQERQLALHLPYFGVTNEPEVSWICPLAGGGGGERCRAGLSAGHSRSL